MSARRDILSSTSLIFRTALAMALLMMVLLVSVIPVSSQSIPCVVLGYVKLDGSPIGGATVSLNDGQSTTSDSSGFYQFAVNNGSSYTATASYNGHSTSSSFTAMGANVHVNLGISSVNPTAQPTNPTASPPTITPTPVPQHDIFTIQGPGGSIAGGSSATITVSRADAGKGTVSVQYATSDGTAKSGTNYVPASGTLTFGDNETSHTFTVSTLHGDENGADLSFNVILHDPSGGASIGNPGTATLTILHEAHGVFVLDTPSYNISDAATTITVTVSRIDGQDSNVSVEYYTIGGSAEAGQNYLPMHGLLAFGDGETSKTLTVTVLEGNMTGKNVTFGIALRNPTGGATIGARSSVLFTISQRTDPLSTVSTLANDINKVFAEHNPGIAGYISNQDVVNRAGRVAATIFAGISLGIIGLFWDQIWEIILRLFDPLRELLMGYFEEVFFHLNVRWRKVRAVSRVPIAAGISMGEIANGLVSAVLLGLAFSYADEHSLNVETIAFFALISAITIIICQMASRLFATRFKMEAEYKFWGVGAISLILTSFLLSMPFAMPAKVLVNEEGEEEEEKKEKTEVKKEKKHIKVPAKTGIISISSPYTGFVLSIGFLLFILYGGLLGEIGLRGIKLSALFCAYNLIPIKPMEGKNVYGWNKLVWAMLFVPSVILYFIIGIVFV